jgi:hypothetical protein
VTRPHPCRGSGRPTAPGAARHPVAVGLGLQPLGVTGTIDDWRTPHVGTLVANLRAAIRPGGIVLAHDGGGDRWGTVQALRTVLPQWLAAGWRFTRPAHPTSTPSTARVPGTSRPRPADSFIGQRVPSHRQHLDTAAPQTRSPCGVPELSRR